LVRDERSSFGTGTMTMVVTAWLAFVAGTVFGFLLIHHTQGTRRRRGSWSARLRPAWPPPLARPGTRTQTEVDAKKDVETTAPGAGLVRRG
jgi:hypothetical protein